MVCNEGTKLCAAPLQFHLPPAVLMLHVCGRSLVTLLLSLHIVLLLVVVTQGILAVCLLQQTCSLLWA